MSTPLQEISWDNLKPVDETGAQALVTAAGSKLAQKRTAVQQIKQQAAKQGYGIEMDWSQLTPEVTADQEAVMRDTGVDQATAAKAIKGGLAKQVPSLPPAVPTRAAPIDQIAAQYEVLKASGDLAKLSPEDYATFTSPLKAAGWEVGADYIKPPAAQPGAYPLWEYQLAKQQGLDVKPPADTRAPITRALARGGEMLAETAKGFLKPAVESVKGTLQGDPFAQPKALYEAIGKPQVDQLQQAYEGWKQDQQKLGPGMVSHETVGHALAGIVPFFGPQAASFGEKVGKGAGKVSEGDMRGWEDIISATPDAVMLAMPLIAKGFAAMDKGVPVEQAMASVADQLKPLLEKRLKEQIEVQGGVGTGAKPRIVLPREEVPNAGERPQVQPEAGPTGETYRGIGNEAGGASEASQVNRLRNSQQAEGQPQGEIAPPANLSRNFRAGTNDATLTFASETQRDLYDLAANERYAMRGGQNKTSQRAVRDTAAMKAKLADQLGISEAEVSTLARQVQDDVKAQMKGVGHLEERAVSDNVLGEQTNVKEPTTEVLRPNATARPQEAAPGAGEGQVGQGAAGAESQGPQRATETRPLGFARQLADHELPTGEPTTYEATPGKFFDINRAKARENIAKMGDVGAEHYVTQEGGAWTKERISTAAMLIRKLDALGDIEGANRVASAASQRALEAGQASAAADLGRLTPEGVLMTAQKTAQRRGVPLTDELAAEVSQRGAEARATFKDFTEVEREVDRNGGDKAVRATANGKKLGLVDRLEAEATKARMRLNERAAKVKAGELKEYGSGGLSTEELLDYATIGAAKIARGAADFGKWSREMIADFGDDIRPHLRDVFNASVQQWHEASKADRMAKLGRQIEAVQAATGLSEDAAKNLLAQKAAARAADSRALMHLAQTMDKINGGSPILRGLKRGAFEIGTLPQTIKTAFDLSMTLRQGGALSIVEPRLSAEAFKKSVKAFGSQKAYDIGVDYIASHPRFDQMRAADLRLDTMRAHPESIIGRSEFYPSELGRQLPGVKQSARAAEMMMDTQRVETFDKWAGELERKAAEEGKTVTPEQYKGIARVINMWSGRAPHFGGKFGAAMQVLPWWSPGWVYSRVQLLNPAYALSLPKGARAIAFRKTAQLYGTYTAAAGMIAASNALLPEDKRIQVSFDPDDPDFFKAKGGWLGENTRVSLLPPGTQPQARFIAKVGKHATLAIQAEAAGNDTERTKQASEIGHTIERYNFSKLKPVEGTAYGLLFNKGKNYIGEKITPGQSAEDILEPMSVNDIIDAYKAEGWGGAAMEAPASILGADVQIYKRQLKQSSSKNPFAGPRNPFQQQQDDLRKIFGR